MLDRDDSHSINRDGVQIDAREIAPLLGLTPERLMAELRAGRIYHCAEETARDDGGCFCITFRYRARMARLIVDADGSTRPGPGHAH